MKELIVIGIAIGVGVFVAFIFALFIREAYCSWKIRDIDRKMRNK